MSKWPKPFRNWKEFCSLTVFVSLWIRYKQAQCKAAFLMEDVSHHGENLALPLKGFSDSCHSRRKCRRISQGWRTRQRLLLYFWLPSIHSASAAIFWTHANQCEIKCTHFFFSKAAAYRKPLFLFPSFFVGERQKKKKCRVAQRYRNIPEIN